jgi:hypothetical protein
LVVDDTVAGGARVLAERHGGYAIDLGAGRLAYETGEMCENGPPGGSALHVWDAHTRRETHGFAFAKGEEGGGGELQVTPDGRALVVRIQTEEASTCAFFDLTGGRRVDLLGPSPCLRLTLAEDGHFAADLHLPRAVGLLDRVTSRTDTVDIASLSSEDTSNVAAVAFTKSGRALLVASDQRVYLLDVPTLRLRGVSGPLMPPTPVAEIQEHDEHLVPRTGELWAMGDRGALVSMEDGVRVLRLPGLEPVWRSAGQVAYDPKADPLVIQDETDHVSFDVHTLAMTRRPTTDYERLHPPEPAENHRLEHPLELALPPLGQTSCMVGPWLFPKEACVVEGGIASLPCNPEETWRWPGARCTQ